MWRFFTRMSKKRGLPPGTLVHIGEKKTAETRILLIEYDNEQYNVSDIDAIDEYSSKAVPGKVRWLDVVGLERVDVIATIGNAFQINPLVMEDILNTGQRPKYDEWDDYAYLVLKLIHINPENYEISPEQVSIIIRDDMIITFQDIEGDDFLHIINRIINNEGKIRKMGVDYLVCSLVDLIVDNYFLVLDKLGERAEYLESGLLKSADQVAQNDIHLLKRELIFLRKSVWPLRELLSAILRGESSYFRDDAMRYIRDIYDHIVEIIDTIELLRETSTSMIDIHLSGINTKMNKVMKFLTMITTIFIPLSVIAGIYGMNFKFMPEIEWRYGYYFALALMGACIMGFLIYFKRKKWFE